MSVWIARVLRSPSADGVFKFNSMTSIVDGMQIESGFQ